VFAWGEGNLSCFSSDEALLMRCKVFLAFSTTSEKKILIFNEQQAINKV
jgi:hypothetical protein